MAELTVTKTCTKCRFEKPIDDFSKNRKSPDGFCCKCKDCDKLYYEANRGDRKLWQKQYRKDNKPYLRAWHREYSLTHKDVISKYQKEHKDEIALKGKEYRQAHREEIRIRNKLYRETHKEDIRQYLIDNKEKTKLRCKQYYENNKEEKRAYSKRYQQTQSGKESSRRRYAKRRALKANARYESFDPKDVLARDGYICQLCGKETRPDWNRYHPLHPEVDHIVPLSKGGDHTRQNTQCLCRLCNGTKNNTGSGDQLRMFG
jgi:5-methylcytosine-specific restriction endonuclease McrA